MKIAGFVYLIMVDVKAMLKIDLTPRRTPKGPLLIPYRPKKMKILNFELEEKLDRHFDVKFDGESDGIFDTY
jgi:hypothetical protein